MKNIEQLTNKYHERYKSENYTHWNFVEYLQHLCRIVGEDRTSILIVIEHERYIDNLIHNLQTK